MAPYLILGMLTAGLISIFIDSRLVLKHIGSKNFSSVFKSTLLGIPIPLCSCGVIPVAATLRESGASKGSTVSFLVSTPQTGVDSILLTYGMLGPVFALFRPIAAFISGLFSGIVINQFDHEEHHHSSKTSVSIDKEESLINRIIDGLKYGFFSLPSDIVKPLVQGLLVAAAIALFIPPNFVAEYFSSNEYIMLIMMLLVSLPVYVCATASIPIAVALMGKGVSAGAIFVFLMAGPATNASSIVVIKNILGSKTMYQYVILISITAIFFGLILDTFFDISHLMISNLNHVHQNSDRISTIITIFFLVILLNAYIKNNWTSSKNHQLTKTIGSSHDKESLSLQVGGMTCSHCKESVKNAVYSCEGVKEASINLQNGEVIIKGTGFDEFLVKEKIKGKGFTLA